MSGAKISYVEISGRRTNVFRTRALIRRVIEAVRGVPDRLLHRRRHLAARDRLSRMDRPRRVMVVCYGNICRSPYLEAVLKRAMPDIRVESAGFVGSGRAVPAFALAISAERGLDLSTFRSRVLAPAILRDADLVVVMDAHQARSVERLFAVPRRRIVIAGDLDPIRPVTRAIQDPWQQPLAMFESSFDRLDRCAAMLVSLLTR